MEKGIFYNGLFQESPMNISPGIESILGSSSHHLEMQAAGEVEDPPETLHMAWGLWLHHRDALHRLEQKYDTEHVLRNARAADDILHYLDYVPKIGHDEHKIEAHSGIEYDYMEEDAIYNAETSLKEETDEPEPQVNEGLEEEIEQEIANSDMDEQEEDESKNFPLIPAQKGNSIFENKKDLMKFLKASGIGIEYILSSSHAS